MGTTVSIDRHTDSEKGSSGLLDREVIRLVLTGGKRPEPAIYLLPGDQAWVFNIEKTCQTGRVTGIDY